MIKNSPRSGLLTAVPPPGLGTSGACLPVHPSPLTENQHLLQGEVGECGAGGLAAAARGAAVTCAVLLARLKLCCFILKRSGRSGVEQLSVMEPCTLHNL